MNIGDKVRAIHGVEEGIITSIVDDKIVEIETADGFSMPFVKSELVVVASDENSYFNKEEDESALKVQKSGKKNIPNSPTGNLIKNKGIYFAFVQATNDLYHLHLINNTELDILATVGEEKKGQYKMVLVEKVGSKKSQTVSQYQLSAFDSWPKFDIKLLMGRENRSHNFPPMAKSVRFKASTFHKSIGTAPILNQKAFLFQIDKEKIEVTPEEMVEAIEKRSESVTENTITPTRNKQKGKALEIDLHIEKLSDDADFLAPNECLDIQVKHFEKALDQAISEQADSITFIHGVGNGTLRHAIHKQISDHPDVDFFEDANKEKFGYGATRIKLK
ncbi:MAG: hypothetical protein GY827_08795 [Cytophagales bacterium]|nr:hypothetical protein [Cytophagales bacterium]